MDRKTEIKKDLWKIMQDIYKISEDRTMTARQEEFFSKAVDYLDANISLRRKVIKDKPVENKDEYVNPDWAKFD